MMYCPKCNKEYDGKFCPECGTKLIEKPATSGVSLNLGDANAISGGLHLADSHDVQNIQNTCNTTIDNSQTVNNSTFYEAQNTQTEIQQENEIVEMIPIKKCYQLSEDVLVLIHMQTILAAKIQNQVR